MLFNKCEQSNRKLIEDSNKDYKTKFDHKCTYIIDKCTYKLHLQWQLVAGKPAGALRVVWILHVSLASIHSPDDEFMAR